MESQSTLTGHEHLQILCPTCKTGLLDYNSTGKMHCSACDASYQVDEGVIDLLPTSKEPPAAVPMEWDSFIKIYESRLWRRNPIFSFLMGISFDKELELIMNVADLKGDETFLDLGCGPGIYTRPFAQKLHAGTAVGLDLSMPVLNYAVRKAHSEGIENLVFIRGDALDLPFPDDQFDAIICCGALHLFPYPEVLQKVTHILKPGGRFIAAAARVPNIGPLSERMRDWYYRTSGVKGFFPDELAALFCEGGLTNITYHHSLLWWLIMSGVKPQ